MDHIFNMGKSSRDQNLILDPDGLKRRSKHKANGKTPKINAKTLRKSAQQKQKAARQATRMNLKNKRRNT